MSAGNVPMVHDAVPALRLTFEHPAGAVPSTRNVTSPVGAGPPATRTTVTDRLTGSATVAPDDGVADSETPGAACATWLSARDAV